MKTFRKSSDGPLKNTNGMPIAIRKPISERGNDYYDYMRAMQLGYKPDETGHWPSRDYVTGDYLKLPGHPTIPLSVMYDILSGYDVTRNEEGRYRSTPKKLQYSNYFQNGGVVGGGDPPGTIYVDNANDPRFKAYTDSSDLYNKYKLNESKVNAYLERKKTSDEKLKGIAEAYEIAIRNFNNVKIYALKNNITFDKKYYYDKYIKPISEKYAILLNIEREIENKYYNNIEDQYALGSSYSRPVDINIIGGNRNYYRNAIGTDIPFNKIITESEEAKKLNQEIQPINMKYLDDKRTKESFYFYPEYKKPVVEVKIKPDITNVVSNTSNTQTKEDTSNTQTKEDTNKSEGMKRLTREQYDAYLKNKKGKTGNWISPFGEPVNLGGAKGDTFSTNMFGAPKTFKKGGMTSERVINVEGDELEVNPNTLMIEQDFKGLPPHPANGKNPIGNVAAKKSNVIIPKDMRESYIFGNTDDKRNIINGVVQRQIINNLIKNNNLKYSFGNNKMSIGGDVAMGAAKGASTGLAFGSVVPGVGNIVGTAVGAIVGAGTGLFKGMKANKVKYDLENERIMEEGKTFGSNINANIVPEENVLPEDNLMQYGGRVKGTNGTSDTTKKITDYKTFEKPLTDREKSGLLTTVPVDELDNPDRIMKAVQPLPDVTITGERMYPEYYTPDMIRMAKAVTGGRNDFLRNAADIVGGVMSVPQAAVTSLVRGGKDWDKVGTDEQRYPSEFIPKTGNQYVDIGLGFVTDAITDPMSYLGVGAAKSLLYSPKNIGKLFSKSNAIKKSNLPMSLKSRIDDHIKGIGTGIDEFIQTRKSGYAGEKRPLSEIFPITKNQKKLVNQKQDKALEVSEQWLDKYFYDKSGLVRPEIRNKIDAAFKREGITNSPEYFLDNYSLIKNIDNPLNSGKTRLVNTRKKNLLKTNDIIKEDLDYIARNRSSIGGFKSGNNAYTFRNRGLYQQKNEPIKFIGTHEKGHLAQDFGIAKFDNRFLEDIIFSDKTNKDYLPWGSLFSKSNIMEFPYFYNRTDTEFGKMLNDVMVRGDNKEYKEMMKAIYSGKKVDPIKFKIAKDKAYKWAGSGKELHSDLLGEKQRLSESYMKHFNATENDAINYLHANEDDALSRIIKVGKLDKFFKPNISKEKKLEVLKYFISAAPVIGTGTAAYQINKFKKSNQ